jgi:hypothetical protein
MFQDEEKATTDDVQFLLLRVFFWIFVIALIALIHFDAQKTKEKKQTKQKEQCLTTPSN